MSVAFPLGAPAPASAALPARSRRARAGANLWPLLLFGALSLLLFGIPLLGGGTRILAADPLDSSAFMWFLAWWPHALLHGLNPFVTHAIFYPEGFNLTWAAAMPGPAIVLAPVTLLFGPATTWNVIELAAPALSAWTMFLLCRHLTGRAMPALIAGYLYGFSPYVLHNLTGGPDLVLVWPLPLLVLLAVRQIEGSVTRRRFVIATAALLVAQYLTSTEVLLTATVFGVLALIVAYLLLADLRPALAQLVIPLGLAGIAAGVVISPFLLVFLLGQHYPPGAIYFSADLAAFVLPPPLVALRLHAGPQYIGSNTQNYLGPPLLALVALTVWRWRRERRIWMVAACLGLAMIAATGEHLTVRGHHTGLWMPWSAARALPVLHYAIPTRLSLFVTLAAAVLVALALARTRRPRPRVRELPLWALALVAVAFVFPAVGNPAFDTPIAAPAFFAQGKFHPYLNSRDHVLTVPAWGPNQWWVAAAGFPFSLSAGYAGNPFPPSYTRYPTWTTLLTGQLTRDYAPQLRRFLAAKRVTAIVVQQGYPGPWRQLFGSLGVQPRSVGGVWLYQLRTAT